MHCFELRGPTRYCNDLTYGMHQVPGTRYALLEACCTSYEYILYIQDHALHYRQFGLFRRFLFENCKNNGTMRHMLWLARPFSCVLCAARAKQQWSIDHGLPMPTLGCLVPLRTTTAALRRLVLLCCCCAKSYQVPGTSYCKTGTKA